MANAIVASCVVLTLAALYILARILTHLPRSANPRPRGPVRRLLRIALRRAARRHEHRLTPVD